MNLKRRIENERGQTMTEFAFVLPILLVLLFGIIQFGIIFNNYVALTDAARAASRKGAVSRSASNPKGDCEASGYAAGTNLRNPGTDFVLTCDSTWAIGSDVTVTSEPIAQDESHVRTKSVAGFVPQFLRFTPA